MQNAVGSLVSCDVCREAIPDYLTLCLIILLVTASFRTHDTGQSSNTLKFIYTNPLVEMRQSEWVALIDLAFTISGVSAQTKRQ